MRKHTSSRSRICALILVFFAAAFLLPACRTGDSQLYLLAAIVPGVMLVLLLLPSAVFFLDRSSLAPALVLCGFGILTSAALSPQEAVSQGFRCAAAMLSLFFGVVLIRAYRPSFAAASGSAVIALGLLSFPFWGAENSFLLTEVGIVFLLLSVTAFLALRMKLPALLFVLGGLSLFLIQRLFCAAAVWGVIGILLFWAVSGSTLWSILALGTVTGLFSGFLLLSSFSAEKTGESLLSGLSALSVLPPEQFRESAVHASRPLFMLLGEQYGLIVLLCSVLLLCLILLRGTSLALHARKSFHASLALGVVLMLGLRTVSFLLSAIGLMPVEAGDIPFLTASLPDLCAHGLLLGLLSGISARNEADLAEDARLAMLAH